MRRFHPLLARELCLALVLGALVAGGCSKDSRAKPSPWDDVYRPAVVTSDARKSARVGASPLLAHVPGDTPFVFTGFEPTPGGYWSRVCRELCPILAAVLGVQPDDLRGRDGRVSAAIFAGFAHRLDDAGLTQLGFGPSPRWVVYGLGLTPVLRVEVADGAAVMAAIERIAADAPLLLERREVAGRPFRVGHINSANAVAVGVVDDQLVVAWDETGALERAAQRLFDGTRPVPAMADGAALAQVRAEYGFAPYGVGYVDLARALEVYSDGDSEACKTARGRIAEVVPRIVFGYDELTSTRLAATAIVETTVGDRLQPLHVSVPGFTSRLPQGALAAAGVAIDRDGLAPLGKLLVPWATMYRLACGTLPFELPGLGGGSSQALELVPAELVAEVRGGVVVATDGKTDSAIPQKVAGYAIIGLIAGDRFLAALSSLLARGGVKGAQADGAYHVVDVGDMATFLASPARVAGRKSAFVFAAGDRARANADESLRDQPGVKRPLALIGVDVGRASRPLHRFLPLPTDVDSGLLPEPSMKKLHVAAEALVGFAVASVYLGDRGLELVTRIDLGTGSGGLDR